MKNFVKKKAFSLLEMVFAVVIIGIIASVALPKLFDTTNDATAATINKDVVAITSAIQAQYMLNNDVDKISDIITLNNSIWDIEDKRVTFKEKDFACVEVVLRNYELEVTVHENVGEICKKIYEKGLVDTTYSLN